MRDDFDAKTKEILARRVGYRCSNPDCGKLTSGPQEDPTKAVNIGVAAHITAASGGGQRYDPSLSPEERRSVDNGLWLCQNCAKLIDSDVQRYTPELLREWKRQAEEEAHEEVAGIRYPSSPKTAVGELTSQLEEAQKSLAVYSDSGLLCPHCGALLETREYHSELVEYDGRDIDVGHELIRYECGCEIVDGKVQRNCTRGGLKLRCG